MLSCVKSESAMDAWMDRASRHVRSFPATRCSFHPHVLYVLARDSTATHSRSHSECPPLPLDVIHVLLQRETAYDRSSELAKICATVIQLGAFIAVAHGTVSLLRVICR